MIFEDLQEILNKAKPVVVVKGGQIDKDAPEVIAMNDAYFKLKGKKVGVGTCRNCIFDAFFELKQITNEQFNIMNQAKTFKLKRFPIYFGPRHQHYTNANITDDIAIEMVKHNRVNAANFENPEAVLAAASATVSAPASVTDTEKENGAPQAPNAAEPKTDVSIVEKKSDTPVAPKAPEPKKDTKFKKNDKKKK